MFFIYVYVKRSSQITFEHKTLLKLKNSEAESKLTITSPYFHSNTCTMHGQPNLSQSRP
jgi:hypothetical protein